MTRSGRKYHKECELISRTQYLGESKEETKKKYIELANHFFQLKSGDLFRQIAEEDLSDLKSSKFILSPLNKIKENEK